MDSYGDTGAHGQQPPPPTMPLAEASSSAVRRSIALAPRNHSGASPRDHTAMDPTLIPLGITDFTPGLVLRHNLNRQKTTHVNPVDGYRRPGPARMFTCSERNEAKRGNGNTEFFGAANATNPDTDTATNKSRTTYPSRRTPLQSRAEDTGRGTHRHRNQSVKNRHTGIRDTTEDLRIIQAYQDTPLHHSTAKVHEYPYNARVSTLRVQIRLWPAPPLSDPDHGSLTSVNIPV